MSKSSVFYIQYHTTLKNESQNILTFTLNYIKNIVKIEHFSYLCTINH